MANQDHLALLKEGGELWNQWRENNLAIRPDLSNADLKGAYLRECNLFEANLTEAHLEGSNLREAHLERASLRMAFFSNATKLNDVSFEGLVEEADRFAYRAQILQRVVWRHRHKWLKYLFSWFLYLLAGYGYRPGRSLIMYLFLIIGFAGAFYAFGHPAWYEALVVSLTAFHGRGFFSQQYQPGDPQSIIAALEAVMGLSV